MAVRKHGTLVENTVATVTLTADLQHVEVVNRTGDAEIFVTVDGTAPTVAGDDAFIVPAAICARELPAPKGAPTVVKLISDGAPDYSVGAM